LQLTNDQRELQELIRRFFADKVTSSYQRTRIQSGLRSDPAFLKALGELGLEEGFSGEGALFSFIELSLLAEESGRVLLPEPVVERLFGAHVFLNLLSDEASLIFKSLVPKGATVAVALPLSCSVTFSCSEERANQGTLKGTVLWGFGLEGASHLVGFALLNGNKRAFVAELSGQNVTVSRTSSLDLTSSLSQVTFSDTSVAILDVDSSGICEDAFEVLKACEVSGICERVIEMTTEYVKTREQFGVPIGGFQAIQHKLADIYAQSQSLAALSRFAAWSVVHSPDQRRLTARAAALQAASVGPTVCEVALQCHGGIGFTWEYDLHLYLRRAKLLESVLGLSEARAQELIERSR